MTNLGECQYYLDIIITRDRANRILRLGQIGYIQKFITEYDIWEFKEIPIPISTKKYQAAKKNFQVTKASRIAYQSAIELLIYIILGTRSNIAYIILVISQYDSNSNKSH